MVFLGAEYVNLKTRKPSKKEKQRIDHTIEKIKALADDQIQFIYDGGKSIFIPVYKAYKDSFIQTIIDHYPVKTDFDLFKSTAIYERYMLNAAQFSAAKSLSESKMIQSLLYRDGKRQDYSSFKAEAKEVTDVFNETWLRTEYDSSVRNAVAGEQFRRYRDDQSAYPYWEYLLTTSLHPRDEHLRLVGKIFQIGDPEGDLVFPPDGWNCGCGSRQVSDLEGRELAKGSDYIDDVDPQFRFNPADSGILPKNSHSYHEALATANEANGHTFGVSSKSGKTTLAAKGMHMMLDKWHDWHHEYHSDHNSITFQNQETYANVILTQKAFNEIKNHPQGFEQLADTIGKPQEIWSNWVNASEQKAVNRVYIKDNYCVWTTDGVITDARQMLDVNSARKGVLI